MTDFSNETLTNIPDTHGFNLKNLVNGDAAQT